MPLRYRIALFVLFHCVTCVSSYANIRVTPDYAMTEENVVVACAEKWIVVSGYYKFAKINKNKKINSESNLPFDIKLPVPLPKDIKSEEGLIELINPVLKYKDKEYRPKYENRDLTLVTEVELVPNAQCAVFRFNIPGASISDEAVFFVQYNQPIIEIEGKPHASYVPFIPYAGEMKLDEDAFVITFESRTEATLRLHDPTMHKVIRKKADQVSLKAENGKIIYVEIVPPSDSSAIPQ